MGELKTIEGIVHKIVFLNAENGFVIARLDVDGESDLVTILGTIPMIGVGQMLRCTGEWQTDKRFGLQFRVLRYDSVIPQSGEGLERFLSSGFIPGIGKVWAKRLVEKFGTELGAIIEKEPEHLTEIKGFGENRAGKLRKAWLEQAHVKDIMIFLQTYGITATQAIKIHRAYGHQSIAHVKENPYRLAMDIAGIGFLTADQIARNLGFDLSSPERAKAGIIYAMEQASSSEGHCYLPAPDLIRRAEELLKIERGIIADALVGLVASKRIFAEDFLKTDGLLSANQLSEEMLAGKDNNIGIYLKPFFLDETDTAAKLAMINSTPQALAPIRAQNAARWAEKKAEITLAEGQKKALVQALKEKATIITGGPGTGKTTLINLIVMIFDAKNFQVLLAAPTGRAAKRLAEITGREAKTIHRLLEFSPKAGTFLRNESNPLDCDILILDEVSMIDISLMADLLKAVAPDTKIILSGDADQLPSVGPGNVLKDIIASDAVAVARLDYIFRQEETSLIIVNAHRINRGEFPIVMRDQDKKDLDFYFIECDESEAVLRTIKKLVSERIPEKFGYDSVTDIQVLSPMHKGPVGVENLNRELQELLNPDGEKITHGNRGFRVNDKVMQIKNNYLKDVFNGDMGTVLGTAINEHEENVLKVNFDESVVEYLPQDMDQLVLSYAISVHKSQGCEYKAVIAPTVTQHYMLLKRNLLYTAVTRGKELVVLVGSKKAINIAVKNDQILKRNTHLDERIIKRQSEWRRRDSESAHQ